GVDVQSSDVGDGRDVEVADREAVASEKGRGDVDGVFVGESGGHDGGRERRSALDVDAPEVTRIQLGEDRREVATAGLDEADRMTAQRRIRGHLPFADDDGDRL